MNCYIFANVMDTTMIIAILLGLRHSIVKSWQQLHIESWNSTIIKKTIVTNYTFFVVVSFSRINFYT